MSIVSSVILSNTLEAVRCRTHNREEQRRNVHEQHTDHLGNVYDRFWTTTPEADVNAALAAHAAEIEAQLRDQEIAANIEEALA